MPLLRAKLCRFDDRDSVLFLTVHHSVSDAWSLQVILRDLGGRSIEAMALAGRISTARGIRISMADLFKASTLGDMDRRLDLMADARK